MSALYQEYKSQESSNLNSLVMSVAWVGAVMEFYGDNLLCVRVVELRQLDLDRPVVCRVIRLVDLPGN